MVFVVRRMSATKVFRPVRGDYTPSSTIHLHPLFNAHAHTSKKDKILGPISIAFFLSFLS